MFLGNIRKRTSEKDKPLFTKTKTIKNHFPDSFEFGIEWSEFVKKVDNYYRTKIKKVGI